MAMGHDVQPKIFPPLNSRLMATIIWGLMLSPFLVEAAAGTTSSGKSKCTQRVPVSKWDTCTSLATSNRLAPATLMQLNPGLDCARLPSGVCVAADGMDVPPECGKYAEVKADKRGHTDDSCAAIAQRSDLQSVEELVHLNPGLECEGLKAGQLLCVQEYHQAKAESRCINWEEVEGDSETNRCTIFPLEFNPQVDCDDGPIPQGSRLRGCRAMVKVPAKKIKCTQYKAFTSDGNTNYCLIKGGLDNKDVLIRHLQLNNHLYCGKGAEGRNVVVCMEGDIMDPLEDVNTPGSYTRDHILLHLLNKLQHSPNLPKPGAGGSETGSPFQGGTQGMSGTDAHFIRKARKLPNSFTEDAAKLVHMATVGVQQYKRSGNQLMGHAAWGAVMKALAAADFSSDLFDLQAKDTEFSTYVSRMLYNQKRDVMCKSLTPAAARRAQLLPAAECFCDPEQHVLRCEIMLGEAFTILKKQHSGGSEHAGTPDDTPPVRIRDSIGLPNTVVPAEEEATAAAGASAANTWIVEESQAELYRSAGADPALGIMDSAATEAYHAANTNSSTSTRSLMQPGTSSNTVIDENLITLTNALIAGKNEVCKKVKGAMDDMVEKLKEFAATCVVNYDKGADFCGGDRTCVTVGCPAIDLQLVSIYLTGTLCIAIPRDNWIRCRAACAAMQLGYNKLGDGTELNCPEACIRYVGDGWVTQYVELGIGVCLGGSAFNAIKFFDALVPDSIESLLGINWKKLLCVDLFRARLSYTTGLLEILVDWNLALLQVNFNISFQLYRPVNYPEVCDCNVSPWACHRFCLKRPGGVAFTGSLTFGIKINLPWPIPDFKLQHTENFNSGLPDCPCPGRLATTRIANDLCPAKQGLLPSSSDCRVCPSGFVSPIGAACMTCPSGTIPNTAGTNCVYCAVDYVAPAAGTSACIKCSPPLKSSKVGGTVCTGRCPGGTGFDQPTQSCKACRAGQFNPGTKDNAVCKNCPRGTASGRAFASRCDPCQRGYVASSEGSAYCTRCGGGYIPAECECDIYGYARADSVGKAATAISKLITPRLTVPIVLGPKLRGIPYWKLFFCKPELKCKSCQICPPGSYSKIGDVECTKCPPGFYQPKAGQTLCRPCPAGTATNDGQTGATACVTCPAGTFTDGCRPLFVLSFNHFKISKIPITKIDFTTPIIKPPVFKPIKTPSVFKPVTGKRLLDTEAPEGFEYVKALTPAQQKGTFATTVLKAPTNRPAARAAPLKAVVFKSPFKFDLLASEQLRPTALACSRCKKCDAGTYSKAAAQATCQICPPGYYQPREGSSVCLECGVGTISAYPGATSCQSCEYGSHSFCNSTDVDFISYRPMLLRAVSISSRMRKCAQGLTGNACKACPGVTYNNKTKKAVVDLTKLPASTVIPPGCPDWCKPGHFSKTGYSPCLTCPRGTYSSTTGAKKCSSCLLGSIPNAVKAATRCNICTVQLSAATGFTCKTIPIIKIPPIIKPPIVKPPIVKLPPISTIPIVTPGTGKRLLKQEGPVEEAAK